MLIILRLDDRASQIMNIRIVNLIIDIRDPIEEIIFHAKNVSG
jgi:hypothetical protein